MLIGGPITWSLKQAGELELLECFDHIFIGDGESEIRIIVEKVKNGEALPKVIENEKRFDLSKALPMHQGLLKRTIHRYYGGIVEVSRGCPFLCEFCDIRVVRDNNRSNNLPIDKIITEIDFLAKNNVGQITLSCDNFIGDLSFAEKVVDKILEWKIKTGLAVSFYTWVTINLFQYETLLKKMRNAGFDLLFIGIESFNKNSLLETAKVQNSSLEIVGALQTIHSYGFIVVGGFIFGFDSDDHNFAQVTLDGIAESGLISGDPNWLTALPGTPLYHRMKLAGRLRKNWDTHGAYKFQTNMVYLLPKKFLIEQFLIFSEKLSGPSFQLERFANYMKLLERGNFISDQKGFGDLRKFLRLVALDRNAVKQFIFRIYMLLSSLQNIRTIISGLWMLIRTRHPLIYWGYFQFWLFTWSNTMVKYSSVKAEDFDIAGLDRIWIESDILPEGYSDLANEQIPENKTKAQRKLTSIQLRKLIKERQ